MTEVSEIGLADLRQRASEIVRQAEQGTRFVVTVSGRPAAMLTPLANHTWLSGSQLQAAFADVPSWGEWERPVYDEAPVDPWQR